MFFLFSLLLSFEVVVRLRKMRSGVVRRKESLSRLWRGTLKVSRLLFTLPMGSTLYLHLLTRPFEYGIPILVLQLESL